MSKQTKNEVSEPLRLFHKTSRGEIFCGDSLTLFRDKIGDHSVDLIMTSPPFGLVRKKDYGNADAHKYLEWFRPFADAFKRALKPRGSLGVAIPPNVIAPAITNSLRSST